MCFLYSVACFYKMQVSFGSTIVCQHAFVLRYFVIANFLLIFPVRRVRCCVVKYTKIVVFAMVWKCSWYLQRLTSYAKLAIMCVAGMCWTHSWQPVVFVMFWWDFVVLPAPRI
jgi:hypothetical protein